VNSSSYQLDDEAYWRFRDLVLNYSGLYFPDKKRSELENALLKALSFAPHHIKGVPDYYQYLRYRATSQARREMARFINLLTIGETHFFRNDAHFNALEKEVLPRLIAHKREAAAALNIDPPIPPQLRLWSAGCATGEEAYSLAILLHKLIPDIDQWRILILATDINEASLVQARQATYSEWSFRERRAKASRQRYFKQKGKGYQLREEIRRMVTFGCHNLKEDDFPAVQNNTVSMDLILCRNVTIYFKSEVTQSIAEKFYRTLNGGGWLMVGHSEPATGMFQAFNGRIIQGTLLYQKITPTPAPDRAKSVKSQTGSMNLTIQVQKKDVLESGDVVAPRPSKPPRRTDLLPPLKPSSDQVSSEMEAYERARNLLSNGRVPEAITTLEKYLDAQSQFAAAHCLLARAYADLGQWDQARRCCEKAIAVDPLLPEVYYVLAMVNEHDGQLEPAIRNLKKVVYLDQERPLAYFNLAMLYKKRAQVGLARRAIKNAIRKIQPWPPEMIIPDSGSTSARSLSAAAQQMLADLGQAE